MTTGTASAERMNGKRNAGFDVLFKNPTPVGVDFIGIIFYKQDASGKDVEFMTEYQQNIGDKNRMYATGNNEIYSARRSLFRLRDRLGQTRNDGASREPDGVFCEDDVDGEVRTFGVGCHAKRCRTHKNQINCINCK